MHYPIMVGILSIGLASCSAELIVKPTDSKPQRGIVYALPMTTFDITISRSLVGCSATEVIVKTNISVEPKHVEDPANLYRLDPQSLSNLFNTSTVNVVFHDTTRFLKSINTVSQSVVAEVASATLQSLASIRGVKLGGAAPESLGQVDAPPLCTVQIIELLRQVKDQSALVKKLTKDVNQQQVELDAAVTAQARLLPGRTDAVDQSVANAKSLLDALSTQLATQLTQLQRLQKPLISEVVTRWPRDGAELKATNLGAISSQTKQLWFGTGTDEEESEDKKENTDPIDQALNVSAAIVKTSTIGRALDDTSTEQWRTSHSGLYYRNPVMAELVFTQGIDGKDSTPPVIFRTPVSVAQLGFVNSLQVKNGSFESTEFSATFDLNGRLVSSESKKTKSASSTTAEILTAATTQYVSLKALEDAQAQTKLTSKLNTLTTQLSILEAQKKIDDFEDTNIEAQVEAYEAQKNLLEAEIAVLEATAKLDKLRTEASE